VNKFFALAGITVAGISMVAMPVSAASAATSCVNQSVWTYEGPDASVVKQWSSDGALLKTISVTIDSPDFAISSDLTKFYDIDNSSGELVTTDAATGGFLSSHAITGESVTSGAGAGVIATGELLIDNSNVIYSINTASYNATVWADLTSADASLPVGERGGSWGVAGDILQLPDGDILVVATNSSIVADAVLVRINKTDHTNATVVGTITGTGDQFWGAARAGDEVFLATDAGTLLKLSSVPTTAGEADVSYTETVTGGGSFWGAAGSNDSTDGAATCVAPAPAAPAAAPALASTGVDSSVLGGLSLGATLLVGAGLVLTAVRRRTSRSAN